MLYVYVDWTEEDSPRPFYVGKGNERRIANLSRNEFHNNVKRKHGLRREIVLETSDETEAYQREVELIYELHTFVNDDLWNGIGTNLTPGGEGIRLPSEETRLKLAQNGRLGCDVRWGKPESHKRASEIHKIVQNRSDVKQRKRVDSSVSMKKRWQNEDERARLTQIQNSDETKQKKSEAMKRYWARKCAMLDK